MMFIEKSAEDIIRTRCISTPEDINLKAIAKSLNAEVREIRLKGCEARIIGKNNRAIISVNTESSKGRRRFSIGHELGHWQLHRGLSFKCNKEDIGNPIQSSKHREREADRFAADLLMPRFLFDPLARTYKHPTFKCILELAGRFRTSKLAVAIRLVESNIFPMVLVCHNQTQREWFKRSKDIPERWFPQESLDHESTAFPILYARTEQDYRQHKVDASAWFDRYDADQYTILEQSIPYGEGRVLTILELYEDEMLEEYQKRPKGMDDLSWR
ncbi:ImmA/IrrE family metallo-endopeptidase [Oceanidesulfovibrio marinus]|uniref:ImmA/IrrE family metallo-endopeptidase n=1 Tax=Oceanidesulfovibrio marinus TaxID=370038 RepID=A0A6P1ZAB9_9BACT|nr:ImmA/IrrE family metallo-endopeptidase [Oceanidesulfovibrio marinus]TVM30544.1 ImmA/IrrE family metallo-endopeptidase [Oceanidesulfovibrio marinus]